MLEAFLGADVFREGLRVYLKTHRLGNARTVDLWTALECVSKKPVALMMRDWTLHVGYPILKVTVEKEKAKEKEKGLPSESETPSEFNSSEINLLVEQHRFLSSGDVKPEEDVLLWHVPLTVKSSEKGGGGGVKSFLVSDRSASVRITSAGTSAQGGTDFLKVNPGHTGFYRVQYSEEMLG